MLSSNQVRQTFIDYFVRNGHTHIASSSLIPHGDKTILFTNAGMNQFKNAFLGLEKREYVRAVTSQKVMRVSGKHNDLENIGITKRHHTFFEMLGNFSLGDYFKEDAMKFALELLEGEFGFPRERLWFTIYENDDESEALWQKVGIKPSRILRFGEKDNFWSMGPTGPCGPNSEIHIFTGDLADNDAKWVNNDNDPDERTAELWNLVFMQFNRDESGVLHPLPQTGVDTGMGFERLVRLLQGKDSNFDTDLFVPLMDKTQQIAKMSDTEREKHRVAYRIIADHARASAFLIGDGVLPGNDGRNYVLRMIMRRAMRYGRELGLEEPFLYQVADAVIDNMGGYYTDLTRRRQHILQTIHAEEERFERTLDIGLDRLNAVINEVKARNGHTISGESAFKLYDTNGLPLEITRDVARERGISIDEAGFSAARDKAKDIARAASKSQFAADYDDARSYLEALETLVSEGKLPETGVNYLPYGEMRLETQVVGLLRDGELTGSVVKGERVDVIVRDTPFYVESGGQISDTGLICARVGKETDEEPAWCVAVKDTRRPVPGLVVHSCVVEWGTPQVGDVCAAQVDESRRWAIQRNHTATHLLQKSLRTVLGSHVGQQGSLVAPDRLRFDFSHGAALSKEEIEQVADILNDAILDNLPVTDRQLPYQQAIDMGAMAFFSEKYGDVVRVVSVGQPGDQPFSMELCGGTHVGLTGDIGSAMILSESAVGAGVRRIEAVTGRGVLELAKKQSQQIADIARTLNTTPDQLTDQIGKLTSQMADTEKQLDAARHELAKLRFDALVDGAQEINGTHVLVAEVQADAADLLRDMADWYRTRFSSGVIVLGAVIGDKPTLLAAATKDLASTKKVDAGKLIKEIAPFVGGGGGGRPDLAQAGGKDPTKLPDALAKARELLASL
jgi:alanyl-tRNA synthetase